MIRRAAERAAAAAARAAGWVGALSRREQSLWTVGYVVASAAMAFGLHWWVLATVLCALIWSTGQLAARLWRLDQL